MRRGIFDVLFVMRSSELKQHMHKRCKSNSTPEQIVRKHNEDILKEDVHKVLFCPKITNNQVSLVNHNTTQHMGQLKRCATHVEASLKVERL